MKYLTLSNQTTKNRNFFIFFLLYLIKIKNRKKCFLLSVRFRENFQLILKNEANLTYINEKENNIFFHLKLLIIAIFTQNINYIISKKILVYKNKTPRRLMCWKIKYNNYKFNQALDRIQSSRV